MLNHPRPVAGSPYFLEEEQLTDDWLESLVDDHDIPYYADIERPDRVPATAVDRKHALAEEILSAAGARTGFGHHEEIRKSMVEWAPERGETNPDDPGFWRKMVFSLTPKERHFGRIDRDDNQYKKRETVLAWASDCIDDEVVQEVEQELIDEWRQAWADHVEFLAEQHAIRQFRNDPPERHNGWERFEAAHDAVKLAYRGTAYGTDAIVAVFVDEEDELNCLEYTVDVWETAGGDPLTARPNRYPPGTDPETAYAQLKSHLEMIDVEQSEESSETDSGSEQIDAAS